MNSELFLVVLSYAIICTRADTLAQIDAPKFAFATVAVGEEPVHAEPYLLSALAMGQALQEVHSLYPLVVLVSAWDVKSQRRLKEHCRNCIPRLVSPLHSMPPARRHELPANWAYAWTKLHLWDLPYDKVVFLDADVIIMKNIDSLFEYPDLTLARNRCGLCCSHALGTLESYSTGMMVFRPNMQDRADLSRSLDGAWDSELHAIQYILDVAAVFPDVDNVFTITTLASCGCRPGDPNSSYVASLPAHPTMQNKVRFTSQYEYFSGVRDEDVRTAHAFNPKPWYAENVNGVWQAPCGGQFVGRWHALVNAAMKENYRPMDAEQEWASFSNSVWFENSIDSGNVSVGDHVKTILQKCPAGAIRHALVTVVRLLWSPHGLGMSAARAIRRILSPWMMAPGAKPPMRMLPEVDTCLREFTTAVQDWIETQIDHKAVMAWVSYVLALVAIVLPSCKGTCFLEKLVKIVMALLQSGYEKVAEAYFYNWRTVVHWKTVWQLPPLYEPSLRSLPVWDVSKDFDGDGFIPKLVSALRSHWRELLSEYQALISTNPSASRLAYPNLNLHAGNWTKVMLYDGEMGNYWPHNRDTLYAGEAYPPRVLHPRLCEQMPFTCNLIQPLVPGIVDPTLPYIQADQEQVNFFSLAPGSRLLWHSAVQNGRLTVHTCLSGCSDASFLQVGTHRLRWKEGEPIIFDDSFFHHVQIDPELLAPRVVFHVMVMHPDIDTSEKQDRVKPKFMSAF